MNDRRRRTFMDYPPRRKFVQAVRSYARQAAAAREGTPRAIFLRINWGVRRSKPGAGCGAGFWSFAAASRGQMWRTAFARNCVCHRLRMTR